MPQRFWEIIGYTGTVLLPLWFGYGMATTYKTQWDFGPKYGMPVAVLAPDGKHYADGEPIYPFERFIKSGLQEEIELAWLALLGSGLVYLFYLLWQLDATVKRIMERERRFPLRR